MQSPNIKKAKMLEDYKILILFENNETRLFDIKPYLNYPIFKPLQDINNFKDYKMVDGTIEWGCGADLSQDTFYLESIPYDSTESITV